MEMFASHSRPNIICQSQVKWITVYQTAGERELGPSLSLERARLLKQGAGLQTVNKSRLLSGNDKGITIIGPVVSRIIASYIA